MLFDLGIHTYGDIFFVDHVYLSHAGNYKAISKSKQQEQLQDSKWWRIFKIIITHWFLSILPYCLELWSSRINAWSCLVAVGIKHRNKNKFRVSNKCWVSNKRLV